MSELAQAAAKDMLEELLDIESGLTRWEVSFIDDLSRWEGNFTPKQIEALERIYDRRT